ncbi:hypothetical protein HB981_07085 [Listeria seeligeri]|uniref:hypothetical protein n=1 Tax=Listeria seeligeri TaxID=1640 RepID=UPI0016233AF4|nr:hypothetical protein [Listeria seeligeri]MBC1479736.1 hypothetical protein [Listeria seeligeri]MBC1538656.1 hypothetical protein [Listeria seeligeri]MBC1555976.1 hypothetical protein [Listeria seeligeri]MBC1719777.1 hypothetical protein [Listeria seeligeri]MBC1726270.1 hypothetical protein [Listeria seeligeri]
MIYSIGMTTMDSYDEKKQEYFSIMSEIRSVVNPLFDKYDIYEYTIDRKKRGDVVFPLKPKRFLNFFKSEPMRKNPEIMEYNKFIIVTKGVDIKTLLSEVSDLNKRENIECFLVQNTIMTYQILEGEAINFYAKDLKFLVEELAF